MVLLPHQGDPCPGTGIIELAGGRVMRHLRVTFQANDTLPELLGGVDGSFGPGTSFARIPGSSEFYVFVTSGRDGRHLVGESKLVVGGPTNACATVRLHLLNCLIPEADADWVIGDWHLSFHRTECAYDLTRLSLPEYEINLTHALELRRNDAKPFSWEEIETFVRKVLVFLSFANGSQSPAPVAFGYDASGTTQFFRFVTPPRTIPTNRRSWATKVESAALEETLRLYLHATNNAFWENILDRAIEWQSLAEAASHDSTEQALFAIQLLLEMLAYVVLVEDSQLLGEDGYGKLPAADRISLLCGQTGQPVALPSGWVELDTFCSANSIRNVGELIATLRNKLVHPTKKNREYLERVPALVRLFAVMSGFQIASLAILNLIGYKREYFDTLTRRQRDVPWR